MPNKPMPNKPMPNKPMPNVQTPGEVIKHGYNPPKPSIILKPPSPPKSPK